ncbi:uncharacterized protein TNCT_291501 [Trichonephila clavata]|uniref:Uncharacterized protein n=1 Tax=Trichonephila clavata TaxID=2740835 RepID=A0A8X6EY33_TRICU|nr:uncharacterized protein TNCT_291501 [Trichonephila clavata]
MCNIVDYMKNLTKVMVTHEILKNIAWGVTMANYIRNSENRHGSTKTSGQQNSKKKGSGRNPRNLSNNNSEGDYNITQRRKITMDDFWGNVLPEPSVPENAWAKGATAKNENQALFGGDDKRYPTNIQPPVENFWEKRKEKLETRKAMEPANQTEEERMVQKALELSQLEALEMEEKRKKLEEEYELQQLILKGNPTFFTEFQTKDELNSIAATDDYLDPEILESFNDDFVSNFDKEATYKCQKELEDYWSQKKNKKHDKRKKNKDQFLKYEDTHEEHLEDCSSQSWKNKKYVYKSEKDELKQKENLASQSEKADSVSNSNNQGALKKITRVIDMFGGWGSNSSHIDNSKSSQKQDNLEFSSVSDEVVSKSEETILKDVKVTKNISMENNKLDKNSPRLSKTRNSAMNINDCVVSSKKSFSDNNVDKKCQRQDSIPKLDSAFSKAVESSSKSNAKEICDSLENEKCSYKKEQNTLANNDVMSSAVQDYTDLSLTSSDLFTKATVPTYEQTKKILNFASKDSTLKQHSIIHKNVSENLQKLPKNTLPMNEKVPSDLNQPNMNQDILANEIARNNSAYSLPNVPESIKNTISSDQDKKGLLLNQTASLGNFSAEALPNSQINASISDPLPFNSNQIKDSISFLNDSIVTTNTESNFIDPPIPAPEPEPCQPDATKSNLMNPNFMMNMNPQIMHQMMLLSNSFIVQQLHQMNMYYKTMGGLPVLSGSPVPACANAQYPPIFNSPLGNIPPNTHVHNANFIPQKDSRDCPPLPLHERLDPKSQSCTSEIFGGSSNHAKPTTIKFEESWLSDIMSEGAAYADMDSYIPPPKMPEATSTATPHFSTVENKIGLQVSQSYPHSVYEDGSTTQPYNCGIKKPESRSKAVDYNQPQKRDGKNDGWDILDEKEEAGISDEFLATGWGNIENESSNKYSSWDEDIDGWGCSATQPMWNSTRYESEKSTAIRQPSRQPLAKTYYRQGKF